jgi:EmrB/QacA subfamily drug resistance transporter
MNGMAQTTEPEAADSATPARRRAGIGFRSERGPVLVALMLATGLVAIDSTIIATAGPAIVDSLGGFAQFPWLFSIYLLAQAVSVPLYGKLADLVGRRPIMLAGIGLFLLGSILCGFAWNMSVLIMFRALQGLGAGAVQPMAMTISADIYTVPERAKVTGYLSSVWGVSAVIGPTLGGVFSDYLTWRWIFFVNVPLCLAAVAMLMRHFREVVVRRRHRIDVTGTMLLTAGSSLVILALLEGDQGWPWASPAGIGVPVLGVLLLVAFVLVERRAAEPVLPLWVFVRRVLLTSSLVSLAVGATIIGLTLYVPTFAQISLGTSAVIAGFALATLTVGWPISSSQAGRLYLRVGFRWTALVGCAFALAGAVGLLFLDAASSVLSLSAWCFVIGAGLGLVSNPTLIAAQTSVGWAERGVVTGNNMFFRSVGSAVGAAVFGAVANAALPTGVPHAPALVADAAHQVFVVVLLFAVVLTVAVASMPPGKEHVMPAPASRRSASSRKLERP